MFTLVVIQTLAQTVYKQFFYLFRETVHLNKKRFSCLKSCEIII